MGLLDIWVITLVVNFYYRAKTNIQIYKAYADLGYIYNHKEFKKIESKVAEEDNFFEWFVFKFGKFIPIYNLYQSLMRKFDYCINARNNVELFEEYNIIEKMTISEKEKYSRKQTGICALTMRKKIEKNRKKYDFIYLKDGSSILFDYDVDCLDDEKKLLDSIKVLEVRGDLENACPEEVIKKVYDTYIMTCIGIINSYDSPDDFFNNYDKKDKVEVRLTEEKPVQNNLGTNDYLEQGKVKKKVKRK